MDLHAVQMRMAAQTGDVFDLIAGCGPGTERWPCNINGIGTTVDGCDADFRISRRCEQREGYLHLSCVIW